MTIKLNTDQINYLNIGLMIVAAIAAFIKPFETFLFAYAFLGPLHYLTEISWLHDKNYFTKRKYDYILLIVAGVFVTALSLKWIQPSVKFANAGTIITYIAFMAALVFVLVKDIVARVIFLALIIISSMFLSGVSFFDNVFGAFVPTLIHVFIFTGLFILVGALKGRNLSGILSLIVFVVIGFSFFYIHPDHSAYHVSNYVRSSYGYVDNTGHLTDGFISLNETIRRVFKIHEFGTPNMTQAQFIASVNDYFYSNPIMLGVMSFIAFAYLYHYLNWFSKTSVIQWHNIPRARFIAVIILWVASLGLYAYDYSVGLTWLFFLSFTHVLLEFPLNNVTFINIGKEIISIFKAGSFAKQAAPVKQGKAVKTAKAR